MATTASRQPSPLPKQTLVVRDLFRSRTMLAVLAATAVAGCVAYWPAFSFWWARWFEKDSYYSHGPFVPLAIAYVIWFNRKALVGMNLNPANWGFAVIAGAALLGWFAWLGASASIMGFTLPIFLFGAIVAVAGVLVARAMLFPLGLLYFAAVMPESVLTAVSFKLQMLSIQLASVGLGLLRVEAVSRGAFVELPGLTVDVGDACSGFRLVISMLAVATFFAYIRRGPMWGKLALVALSLPLSIAMNTLRITAVAMIGQRWGADALKVAHDWTGYFLLLVTVGLLLLMARILGCGKYREMPSA